MIELNKIAFIDEDGFDFNDGESLIRFDTVAYYPDRNEIIYISNMSAQYLIYKLILGLAMI